MHDYPFVNALQSQLSPDSGALVVFRLQRIFQQLSSFSASGITTPTQCSSSTSTPTNSGSSVCPTPTAVRVNILWHGDDYDDDDNLIGALPES